jgi:hypothetical protein
MVVGNEIPLIAKLELLLLAPVTVTLAPLAVRVPVEVPLDPTATLPKFNVAGLTVNWAFVDVPVPVSCATVEEGFPLLVKVSAALALPAELGLKVTVNDSLWPDGMVTGNDKPLKLNCELLLLALVMVMFAPVAVRVPVAVPLLPTVTLPRLIVEGDMANLP